MPDQQERMIGASPDNPEEREIKTRSTEGNETIRLKFI